MQREGYSTKQLVSSLQNITMKDKEKIEELFQIEGDQRHK